MIYKVWYHDLYKGWHLTKKLSMKSVSSEGVWHSSNYYVKLSFFILISPKTQIPWEGYSTKISLSMAYQ